MKTEQQLKSQKDAMAFAVIISGLLVFATFTLDLNFFARAVILTHIALSFLAGNLGKSRKIGFGQAFFITFFLSSFVGFIITLVSPRLGEQEHKDKMFEMTEKRESVIIQNTIADQLLKLNELRKEGVLTEEEFATQKERLLSI
jgi:signal transduction histidine kinase